MWKYVQHIINILLSQPEGEDTMKVPLHDGIRSKTKPSGKLSKTTCTVLIASNLVMWVLLCYTLLN